MFDLLILTKVIYGFPSLLLFFLARDSDRQRSEGPSFSLQQPEGKSAESGEEECVSSTEKTCVTVLHSLI